MNVRFVIRQIARLLAALSIVLLAIAGWGAILALGFDRPIEGPAAGAFGLSGALGLLIAAGMWGVTRKVSPDLERREALLLVTLSWLLGAALAALPYYLFAQLTNEGTAAALALRSPVNCYFESMSGLTTTGATILTGIGELPMSILLWRSATQWMGGLGIIVLFVAVLPSVGVAGKRLFTVEAATPTPTGVRPEVRETARILLIIYSTLTAVLLALLILAGMSPFDALCHALATLSTGGFSTSDASMGNWSALAQWLVFMFMILGGVNFGLYYQALRKRNTRILKDPELRLYLLILMLVTGLCFALLIGRGPIATTVPQESETGPLSILRHAAFQTASIQTTAGFGTADFDLWPTLAKGALVMLMFVGGCAGSTASGIKVIRLLVVLRLLIQQVERTFRPHVIRPLRIGKSVVSEDVKQDTLAFVLAFLAMWLIGTGAILAVEAGGDIDFATAATASVSSLGNVGPGLARVGAVQNYAWMTDASKLLLCVGMLLGRLEIFPVIVLLSIRFWRQ